MLKSVISIEVFMTTTEQCPLCGNEEIIDDDEIKMEFGLCQACGEVFRRGELNERN